MDSWKRQISIALASLCLFNSNIRAESISCTPTTEVNSLDSIDLKFEVPKIEASSVLSSFSLFDDLLEAQIISLPNKVYALSWQVKAPKKKQPLPAIDSEIELNEISTSGHSGEGVALEERTNSSYIVKNLLDDIVSNLQHTKEHQDIRALFYPDERVTYTKELERRLNSSLEFKVLTYTKREGFVTKVPEDDRETIKKLKLVSSVITKEPMILSPHKSALFEKKDKLDAEELYRVERSENVWQEEVDHEVEHKDLYIPEVLTGIYNLYTYVPKILNENFDVESSVANNVSKSVLKAVSTPFLISISDSDSDNAFELHTLIAKVIDEGVIPAPLEISGSYYKTNQSVKKIQDKKALVKQYHFNRIPNVANIALPAKRIPTIQKHFFVDTPTNMISSEKLATIDSPKLDKHREFVAHDIPSEEIPSTREMILLPIVLQEKDNDHEFQATSIVYIPKDNLRKKGYYVSLRDPGLSDQKKLNEFPKEIYDHEMVRNEYIEAYCLEEKVEAESEAVENDRVLSLMLIRADKENPVDGKVAFYPLQKDQMIYLTEAELGRLLENSKAVLSGGLPDYTKHKDVARFVRRSLDIGGDQREEQAAVNIAFEMPYTQIHSENVKSSIKPNVENAGHPFKAEVVQIAFEDQMGTNDDAVVAVKEVITIETPVDYGKEKELALVTETLEMAFPLQTQLPYLTQKISLQNHIAIDDARFIGDISLPKLIAVNNNKSFFLNPMLSLIDSTAFNEDYTKFGDPSQVNRINRMTDYWLFNLPSLAELNTDSLPEAFNLETRLLTGEAGTDTDFACTIKTYEKDILDPLPVHILYILDTSSTIEAHRFRIFKEAIATSLEQLDSDSTFNIAILSKGKVEMLHEQNPHPTTSSKGYVKRYLRKVEQSSKTSFKDLMSLLEKEKRIASKEITHRSCLILSDGKLASNIRIDRKSLRSLTEIEAGNFSIYTASVSDNNNKAMLSLLAKLNHGFSLYTRTHSSFSRKFSVLLKHIKHPLVHDVMISFPDDDEALAYVSDQVSPILLADKDFTFYGNSKSKRSSRVFIQGRSGDRWINILKELPISTARKGRYNLKKKLASQKTLLSLQSFVDTRDEGHILEAKEFSREYDVSLPVP